MTCARVFVRVYVRVPPTGRAGIIPISEEKGEEKWWRVICCGIYLIHIIATNTAA